VRRYGTKGVGASIVSMTRNVSDLLAVYFFAKESGLTEWKSYAYARCKPKQQCDSSFSDGSKGDACLLVH
jgi:hypothetical protein